MSLLSMFSLSEELVGRTVSNSKIVSLQYSLHTCGVSAKCSYLGFFYEVELYPYLYPIQELCKRLEDDIKGQEEQLLSNVFVQTYKRILKAEEDYEKKQD